MKLKTAFIILAFLGVTMALMSFFTNAHNQSIMNDTFQFLGLEFSVIRTMVLGILLAGFLPSIYFTWKYTQLSKNLKANTSKQQREEGSREVLVQAENLIAHENYQVALDKLEAAGYEVPGTREAKAEVLCRMDRSGDAVHLLRQAFFDGNHAPSGYRLIEFSKNDPSEYVSLLNRMIERFPDEAIKAYMLLLEHHHGAADWDACMDLIPKIDAMGGQIDPRDHDGYRYEWAMCQNPAKKRIEQLKALMRQSPDFVPTYIGLADTYLEEDQVEKAFEIYERGFSQTEHPVFLERLEHFYLSRGNPEDAIQVYRQIMTRDDLPIVRLQLGKLYFKLEVLDEALKVLEPLQSVLGNSPGYLYYLAEIHARRERFDDAYNQVKRILSNLGYPGNLFSCSACRAASSQWQARCNSCGHWNSLNMPAVRHMQDGSRDVAPNIYY